MPIVPTDLVWRLSLPGAGPGDNAAQADPNDSIGGFMSTTAVTDATDNNLFDDITGPENAALTVDYRCVFVLNDHATLPLTAAKVFLQAEVAGGADIAIGLDPAGVVARGSASAQAASPADEETAPAGVTFSAPTTFAAGIALPADLAADECIAVWIRRTATDSAALNADGVTPRIEGSTAA